LLRVDPWSDRNGSGYGLAIRFSSEGHVLRMQPTAQGRNYAKEL